MNEILIKLAKIFKDNNSTLYLVGGAVRDKLLGKKSQDFDVCSNLKFEQLFSALSNSDFIVKIKNPSLQTSIIIYQDLIFEHSTLREETYNEKGSRIPFQINFTHKIEKDYLRRDFTCNALYLDVLKNKIFDFSNGQNDIHNKILKTVKDPEITLSEDGIRILRLIRFSLYLDFKIEDKTKEVGIKNSFLLTKVKGQAKLNEIKKILEFGCESQNYLALNNQKLQALIDFKILNYLFNNKFKNIKLNENLSEIFKFSLSCRDKNFSFICFLLDCYYYFQNNVKLNEKDILEFMLGSLGLSLSIKFKKDFLNLIKALNYLNQSEDLKFFIFINLGIIENIIKILSFSNNKQDILKSKQLSRIFSEIKHCKIPLTQKGLKIKPMQIMKEFPNINKNELSKLINQCFYSVFFEQIKNDKNDILNFIAKLIKNKTN